MIKSYEELAIGKYLAINEIDKQEGDELMKQVKIISVLSGKSEDELLNLPIVEYRQMAEGAEFLMQHVNDKEEIKDEYMVGDFILCPCLKTEKIITAQYIDFQYYCAKGAEGIVEQVATLMLPKGKKYNTDYDILDVQNAIREHLSVATVLSLYAFFLRLYLQSIRNIQTFLIQEVERMPQGEKKEKMRKEMMRIVSQLDGGGLQM